MTRKAKLVPLAPELPPPPKDLTPEAARLWVEIIEAYELDPAALSLLDMACRALMRVREAQTLLATEGLVSQDRFGQRKAHPACGVERDANGIMMRSLKALGLDLEPIRPGPGRPPGR